MKITDYLRHCAVCEMYYPPTDYCCDSCWEKTIYPEINFGSVQLTPEKIPVWYLFLWKNQKIIEKLIYDFKYSGLQSASEHLAELMVSQLFIDPHWCSPDFIVYPTKLNHHRDHGVLLAKSFGKLLGVNTFPLKVADGGPYRQLKRSERLNSRRLSCDQNLVQESKGRAVLFVDDVLTTGSTLRAAKAQLKTKQLQALVVAYKSL